MRNNNIKCSVFFFWCQCICASPKTSTQFVSSTNIPQHNQEKVNTALMPLNIIMPQWSSHSPAVCKKLWCWKQPPSVFVYYFVHTRMFVCTPETNTCIRTLQASLIPAHLRGITPKICCLLKRQSSLISTAAYLLCIVPAGRKKSRTITLGKLWSLQWS